MLTHRVFAPEDMGTESFELTFEHFTTRSVYLVGMYIDDFRLLLGFGLLGNGTRSPLLVTGFFLRGLEVLRDNCIWMTGADVFPKTTSVSIDSPRFTNAALDGANFFAFGNRFLFVHNFIID